MTSVPWEIPVPQEVTGWWPIYYDSFRLPAGVRFEIAGLARIPALLGLRVPVTLEMVGAGTSSGDFELRVPVTLGFSGPPPVDAMLVIPAGIRLSMEAVDRYARSFGFSVTPRIAAGGALAVLPPSVGRFGLSVPPRLTIGGREYVPPRLFNFTASDAAWTIPAWCDGFDEVALGPGGGSQGGSSGSSHGRGGAAGQWATLRVIRGNGAGELPRSITQLAIAVGQGPAAGSTGAATSIVPIGQGAFTVTGAAGAGNGSPNQQGQVPGRRLFNGVSYPAGVNNIPASGANYAGWTGCGDGNLGGIGGGGAGGRGALIGGDPGGPGCRGEAWVYCFQDKDKDNLPPFRTAAAYQNSWLFPNANGGAFPAHAAGDILLVFAYVYAAAIPTIPAQNIIGNVPVWNDLGSAPGGGGRLAWARAVNANMQTGVWTDAFAIGVAVIRNAHQTAPIGGVQIVNTSGAGSMTAPAVILRGMPLGTSQIVHFFGTNATTWGTLTAGFTARQQSTYIRIATKNDTTTSTEVTTSPTNSSLGSSTAATVEILGAAIT